jgi:RNA polymerase sigma-70 factor (ECF subfamily)
MPTSLTEPLVQHIRWSVLVREGDGPLLDRYVGSRDEAAFEALVRRHGPMVLGVCRRILGDAHEAQDAFQATFLVLVKKAASVVPPEMVGNFLYGVARQTALRARSAAVRRRLRERQVADLPEPPARPADPQDDLRDTLDQELACLPQKYRAALVVCDLEGRGHKEAALRLGWPVGTLASRLSRGRRMLAKRLARRGVDPSGGALSACVPPSLVTSTVKAGSLYGAGQAAVRASVVALTKGVLKAMFMNRVRTVAGMFLMAGTLVLGGGLVYRNAAAGQPEVQSQNPAARVPATASKPAKEKKDRLEVVADGKQVEVRLVGGDEEFQAVANKMSYDDDSKQMILIGDVRVRQRRQGKESHDIQGSRMIIDRKTGMVRVEGAGRIGLAVPMLGPVPVALDLGFPVIKDPNDRQQVFNFFLGFTR